MSIIPSKKNIPSNVAAILNVIRNNATTNYQNYIPKAENNTQSIREIGSILMDYPNLQNEFVNALVNRIGLVIATSKSYQNPWSMFKKGFLEYGETIEEIFVNLAKGQSFDPEKAESELFKREIPDVRAAFHIMNFKKFYKVTVSQDQLRQAFLSVEGVSDLISKIIESMTNASNYDEFQVMKYLLARHILNGRIKPVTIPEITDANTKRIVSKIKGISNSFEFMSDKYNIAGVKTHSLKEDQYVLVNSDFDAIIDVEVLAVAFNMDRAKFTGHKVLVDGFGEIDTERLNELFADNNDYVPLTSDELAALNEIPAIIVDKDFFMIYDNMQQVRDQENAQGLYWNYFLHVWKTFSVSPFANNALFVEGEPTVTSVVVTPSSVTVPLVIKDIALNPIVTTTNFAPKTVNYTVEGPATVTRTGVVQLTDEAETGDVIKVTITSTYDPTKSATATITIE